MSRRNTVVKNEFPLMSETGHIYAKDMVEGVTYVFQCHKVVKLEGVYHYTNILGEKFTGQPSDYSIVRELK